MKTIFNILTVSVTEIVLAPRGEDLAGNRKSGDRKVYSKLMELNHKGKRIKKNIVKAKKFFWPTSVSNNGSGCPLTGVGHKNEDGPRLIFSETKINFLKDHHFGNDGACANCGILFYVRNGMLQFFEKVWKEFPKNCHMENEPVLNGLRNLCFKELGIEQSLFEAQNHFLMGIRLLEKLSCTEYEAHVTRMEGCSHKFKKYFSTFCKLGYLLVGRSLKRIDAIHGKGFLHEENLCRNGIYSW